MGSRVRPLGLADLSGLPATCPDCDLIVPAGAEPAWTHETVRAWGQCGWRLVAPVGYNGTLVTEAAVLVAPTESRPRAGALATVPTSPDAAVLVSLRIVSGLRGEGLGRRLVQASAALAARNGRRGLEAVGTRAEGSCCLLPVAWLESVGFQVTRDHPLTPRLRMDLSTTITWRTDLEAAWQRLTGLVSPTPPPETAVRVTRDSVPAHR